MSFQENRDQKSIVVAVLRKTLYNIYLFLLFFIIKVSIIRPITLAALIVELCFLELSMLVIVLKKRFILPAGRHLVTQQLSLNKS